MDTKKLNYKWVVVAACVLMVFTVLGFCSSSKSLYIKPITEALDITRGSFSISDSIRFITTAVINVFFSFLLEKLSVRKLISLGFLALIASMFLYSIATNVWLFYAGSVFLGLGLSWTTTTMVGTVVNMWCKEKKGTIMGIVLSANGLGAALAVQVLTPIIYNTNSQFGFRTAYRVVVAILLIVGIIVVSIIKDKPKGFEGKIETSKKAEKTGDWEGITYKTASHKLYFYLSLFCVFITGMTLQGIVGVFTPLMQDAGIPNSYVATVQSIHSLTLTVAKFAIGFLFDRVGLRKTANTCFIMAITTIAMFPLVSSSKTGLILAMVAGAASSFALPLETIMLPLYALDLFGNKSYAKFLGIFVSVNTAGYAIGAPFFNIFYDVYGNYNIAIYVAIVFMLIAFVTMQYVIKTAHKLR